MRTGSVGVHRRRPPSYTSYIFNPAKHVFVAGGHLHVEDERTQRVLSLGRFGVDETQLLAAMATEEPGNDPGIRALLTQLSHHGIIVHRSLLQEPDERQSRSLGVLATRINDPYAAQTRLSTLRVLVLGVGGTGSVVVQHLLAAGVKHFVLVDGDTVELSNFNRQFTWTSRDVGRAKVDVLQEWILARANEPNVVGIRRFIRDRRDFADLIGSEPPIDIVVSCIDAPVGIEPEIVQAALSARLPVMTGGVGIEFGHVGPLFTADLNFCVHCWYSGARSTQAVPRWSHGVTNTLIGALVAEKIIDWVLGVEVALPVRMTLDFSSFETHLWEARECDHSDAS